MRRSSALLVSALALIQAPWLARPIDFDEANFLVLARGARVDPWRPHDVLVNWQGTTERAFDVLSNPPGIAWLLAPVLDAPVILQRAWMLPWLALAVWGARRLGDRFGEGDASALALLASPIVLLSTPALLPDAPLYAIVLAGLAGFVRAVDAHRSPVPWAVLVGAAGLFRYSALPLVPLLGLYLVLHARPPWPALAGLLPLGLLGLHDWHAYGAWHLLVMGSFQSVANTPEDWHHKLVAALAMAGGAAVLPVYAWTRWSFVGAGVAALVAAPFGWLGALFAAAGGAALAGLPRQRDRWFLLAWGVGGLVFLVTLRFVATRYWLPFLPALILAIPLGRAARWWLLASVSLGMALAADANAQARGVRDLAQQVAALGTGAFTGHWGWQWELERHGWTALDADTRAPRGTLVAMPRQAWPQDVRVACAELVWEGSARAPFPWLPRGYTERGAANLHANWVVGPLRTVAPWTFANDPYERARVCRD